MWIEGKKLLWATLRNLAGLASRMPGVDFNGLIERAERNVLTLSPSACAQVLRVSAVCTTLAGGHADGREVLADSHRSAVRAEVRPAVYGPGEAAVAGTR